MVTKKIKGTIKWMDLEMGFFGLISNNGNEYLPLNLPQKYQINGQKIHCEIKELDGVMTSVMWGTPIDITEIY